MTMADVLTKSEQDMDTAISDLTDGQRTFAHNYGDGVSSQTRQLLHGAFVATAAGLALGGLVGAALGYWRG
jgi:hypothetical protein